MNGCIEKWTIYNVSQGETPTPLLSISHAIEMLVEVSRKEIGETIYLEHSDRGMVCCTAGNGRSTLSFTPQFDKRTQSLVGSRDACSLNGNEKLYHVDGIGSISAIPSDGLLPMLDVMRGLVYILETHQFPDFLFWSDPAVEC